MVSPVPDLDQTSVNAIRSPTITHRGQLRQPTRPPTPAKCARMDANELGRWTRFATKGGIGRCVAIQDCIAEQEEDLMFYKVRTSPLETQVFLAHNVQDDEIVVLMQLPSGDDLYLVCLAAIPARTRIHIVCRVTAKV
jgi:hypothetical protein